MAHYCLCFHECTLQSHCAVQHSTLPTLFIVAMHSCSLSVTELSHQSWTLTAAHSRRCNDAMLRSTSVEYLAPEWGQTGRELTASTEQEEDSWKTYSQEGDRTDTTANRPRRKEGPTNTQEDGRRYNYHAHDWWLREGGSAVNRDEKGNRGKRKRERK